MRERTGSEAAIRLPHTDLSLIFSRSTSVAGSRDGSPSPGDDENASSIRHKFKHLLPETLQKSLAPIALERSKRERSSHRGSRRSESPTARVAANAGWATPKEPGALPSRRRNLPGVTRESAEETREKRAAVGVQPFGIGVCCDIVEDMRIDK